MVHARHALLLPPVTPAPQSPLPLDPPFSHLLSLENRMGTSAGHVQRRLDLPLAPAARKNAGERGHEETQHMSHHHCRAAVTGRQGLPGPWRPAQPSGPPLVRRKRTKEETGLGDETPDRNESKSRSGHSGSTQTPGNQRGAGGWGLQPRPPRGPGTAGPRVGWVVTRTVLTVGAAADTCVACTRHRALGPDQRSLQPRGQGQSTTYFCTVGN